jgi:hypothetical protein
MRDQYVIRFAGGPDPGTAIVGEDQFGYPAPGIIKGTHPGGVYEKVAEDVMPSRIPNGDPIRYADYQWRVEGKVA